MDFYWSYMLLLELPFSYALALAANTQLMYTPCTIAHIHDWSRYSAKGCTDD